MIIVSKWFISRETSQHCYFGDQFYRQTPFTIRPNCQKSLNHTDRGKGKRCNSQKLSFTFLLCVSTRPRELKKKEHDSWRGGVYQWVVDREIRSNITRVIHTWRRNEEIDIFIIYLFIFSHTYTKKPNNIHL